GARCVGGACRFMLGSSVMPGSTPVGMPQPSSGPPNTTAGCAPAQVTALLAQGVPLLGCGMLPTEPTGAVLESMARCVRDALDSGKPFQLLWEIMAEETTHTQGFVGTFEAGEPKVYGFQHDGAAFSPGGAVATWSPCSVFHVLDSCSGSDLRSCFECPPRVADRCSCTQSGESGASPIVRCNDPSVPIDEPPCDPGSCLFDGVCYPSGSSSEDGCCSCVNGQGSCIEPAWCPGWVAIGKRCASSADCGYPMSGLHCRTDFFGERGVCTRDCNFGCPTGTECLAAVPGFDGGAVANMCMRFCPTPDVCAQEVRGAPLGSECDRPEDLTRSYCF
ncbi:MAG TPA: hypothetical protein VK509_18755, partial [Polyangiales bacterium]|nr:hypothetical protein [Polyangiales bacterium]